MKENGQEKSEIEQIKSFDRMRKKLDDYQFLMYSIGKFLFLFWGCALMMLPVSDGDFTIFGVSIWLLSMSAIFHLSPYQVVKEKEKTIGIYEKCKWLPVSRKDIRKVRREYLFHFSVKMGIVVLLCQLFGAALAGKVGFLNVAYPVLVWLFVLGIGNLYTR
ncbi:MAG: hypothetical protein HDR22_07280 [Lachnospiraceae bacterium]|nr:hypothetical protein [Lachnospiraceae bacterium]